MNWEFTQDRPIYTQLTERLKLRIVSGEFRAGEKLPAVRELATQAGVNPNTMQRSLLQLEREGLVFAQRTSGRYVTGDVDAITQVQNDLAEEEIRGFLRRMRDLGYDGEQALSLIRNQLQSKEEEN